MDNVGVDRKYFGPIVSSSLLSHPDVAADATKLRELALPVLGNEEELSEWLGIPLGRLRWFTHDRADETVWHYTRYAIPKRSGGLRVILAPKSELKQLQRKVLWQLINKVQSRTISPAVHGFVPRRSIITNAHQHVGKQVILRMDLESFFPSIHLLRVRDLFESFGYSTPVASTLALLCTEYDRETVIRDGTPHFIAHGPRHLVQGSPTSPALANLAARDLDTELENAATRFNLSYTRYADDLTFSGQTTRISQRFLSATRSTIREQGFRINEKKTSFANRAARQRITGIVVNDETSTPRELRRRLRALLHNAEADGLAKQNRDERPNFESYIQGLIAFVESANPRQATPLREAFQKVHLSAQGSPREPGSHYRPDPLHKPSSLSAPFVRKVKKVIEASEDGSRPDPVRDHDHYIPKIGDRVIDPKFGRGVVAAIRTMGNANVAEIQFNHSKAGTKTLDLSLAHLRPDSHSE